MHLSRARYLKAPPPRASGLLDKPQLLKPPVTPAQQRTGATVHPRSSCTDTRQTHTVSQIISSVGCKKRR
ncbi:hypothetical protein R3I93_014107 [Phoxinus phoxinus]|uniref:Uncharacterized protein n=1 Tax=Phoxinus phoxinus TaxID=58324 RepID=A0AAN9CU25_9TELE